MSQSNSDVDSNSDDDASKYLQSLVDNIDKPNDRMLELLKAKDRNAMAWQQSLQASSSSSKPRSHRRYIDRGRVEGSIRLYKDYFAENPVYHGDHFRRRFRMRRPLFNRIHNAVLIQDNYFEQKRNCTGELGLSTYQKMTAALRMLAYGCCADQCDEYLRIGESTALECMRKFTVAVIQCFAKEYLREPTSADMERLLAENAKRGFPGMLGSLDCMHWNWKNCPASWRGSYKNYKGYTSIVLEGIADHDGWFWHAFFGMPGTFNDVNVMNTSPVFDRMMAGNVPAMPYTVNGNTYMHHYYLGDGIYPKYATIMKTFRDPRGEKEKKFAAFQEGCRKDVERAFGMLQARWGSQKTGYGVESRGSE